MWEPIDIIAMLLTVTICLILILSSVAPVITGTSLSEAKAKLLVGLIGSVVSVVSMYIGATLQRRKDK